MAEYIIERGIRELISGGCEVFEILSALEGLRLAIVSRGGTQAPIGVPLETALDDLRPHLGEGELPILDRVRARLRTVLPSYSSTEAVATLAACERDVRTIRDRMADEVAERLDLER